MKKCTPLWFKEDLEIKITKTRQFQKAFVSSDVQIDRKKAKRKIERHTQADRRTDRQTNRHTDKHTDRQTDGQIDRQANRYIMNDDDRWTDRQRDREIDGQAGGRTDRQAKRQIERGRRCRAFTTFVPSGVLLCYPCITTTHLSFRTLGVALFETSANVLWHLCGTGIEILSPIECIPNHLYLYDDFGKDKLYTISGHIKDIPNDIDIWWYMQRQISPCH